MFFFGKGIVEKYFINPTFIFNFNPITFSTQNPTIVLHYHSYGSSSSAFVLNRCFLQRTSNQPPTFNNLFQNGEVILDLYEDEDIPLTLSVDDFKKVSEKVQSYSKSFRIPQTKRNKRIFNDIFEITRFADGIAFNPYMKTECVLKVDGILVFKGFLRLIDANEKEGEVSYNINLYSESVALKDVLEKRKIGDIDFSELSLLMWFVDACGELSKNFEFCFYNSVILERCRTEVRPRFRKN